jgi:hypothetical protein
VSLLNKPAGKNELPIDLDSGAPAVRGDPPDPDQICLQGTRKALEGNQHPDRDAQFRYINTLAGEFLASGDPVISVDTKKKRVCATKHVISLAQLGGIRRSVPGSNGLPRSERKRGT